MQTDRECRRRPHLLVVILQRTDERGECLGQSHPAEREHRATANRGVGVTSQPDEVGVDSRLNHELCRRRGGRRRGLWRSHRRIPDDALLLEPQNPAELLIDRRGCSPLRRNGLRSNHGLGRTGAGDEQRQSRHAASHQQEASHHG